MKHHPKLLAALIGTALLAGCSSTPTEQQARIVPFSEVRGAPDSADGFYVLGRELQRSGRFDDAERAYRRALELEPAHIEAHNGLAAVSAGRGDVDQAIAILTTLAAKRPDQAHLQGNLGYAHFLKGNYFDARVSLERAVALDPSNERLKEKLAMVMQKLGPQAAPVPMAQLDEQDGVITIAEPARDTIVALSSGVHVLQRLGSAPIAMAETQASEVQSLVPGTPEPGKRSAVRDIVATAGQGTRVEIINGNGIAGMARSVYQSVGGREWQVVRFGNQPGFNVQLTRIEYSKGNRQAARQLAKQLRIAPVYWNNEALGDRVRVVLGHDLRNAKLRRSQAALGDDLNAG